MYLLKRTVGRVVNFSGVQSFLKDDQTGNSCETMTTTNVSHLSFRFTGLDHEFFENPEEVMC